MEMLKITKGITSDYYFFFTHTLPHTDLIDCSILNTNVSEVYTVTCLSDYSYMLYMFESDYIYILHLH